MKMGFVNCFPCSSVLVTLFGSGGRGVVGCESGGGREVIEDLVGLDGGVRECEGDR